MDHHKKSLLQTLLKEKKKLLVRQAELTDKIQEAYKEQNSEENDLTSYNYNNDLQFILNQIEKITETISSIKESSRNIKKHGDYIKVGDSVQIYTDENKTYYYITSAYQYVDPRLGLISENSPLANKILNRKYGEQISIKVNGQTKVCKLLP